MAQGYVYDPSQQISQGFQQAGSSIGNIFTTLVAQKQRDYNLAENAFQNVEALKKNLNIFGQKNITEKSNALLKEASQAIFKDGKIDYSKLGEIRQKVSDINDLKQGYDLGAKEFERMVQLGVANKDNLVSFEKFYKDLSTKMSDENLVKNPMDLQRQMAETYTNNLDVNKMFVKSYLAANPLEKQSRTIDVKDAKGNIIRKVSVASEAPVGFQIDANGNKIIPQDAADKFLVTLQQSNPELLALMKKQAGVAGDMLSDRDIVNAYINKVPTSIVQKEEKSQNELKKEAALVKSAEFEANHLQETYDLKKMLTLSSIAENNAQKMKALASIQKQDLSNINLSDYGINVSKDGKSVDFGAEIPIRVSDPSNPNRTIPFKATGLRTLSKNGKQEVVGYVMTKKIDPETGEAVAHTETTYVPYSIAAQKSLIPSIRNLGKDKEQNISQSLALYNYTGMPSASSENLPQSKPTSSKVKTKASASLSTLNQNDFFNKGF